MAQYLSPVVSHGLLALSLVALSETALANSHVPPAPPPILGATPPPPPPQLPAAQQLKVYYTVNGQTLGPFNAQELQQKIAAGELTRQTLVWMEGMSDWQAAATVVAVAPLLTTAPPQPKFNAAAFLVGTWEYTGTVPIPGMGQAQLQNSMTYRADGTVTGFGSLTNQTQYGPISISMATQGTWTAEPKTENSLILTPNIQITSTGPDGIPLTRTSNTPSLLTIIDRNTVAGPGGERSYRVGN